MAENLFEFLKNVFEKSDPVTPSKNQADDYYMVVRYLSFYPETFLIADAANLLMAKIPPWALGCYLYGRVPLHKRAPFIPYPKKEKGEPVKKELLQKIGKAFCCNPLHAEQTVQLLAREHNVYSLFGLEEKGSGNRQIRGDKTGQGKKVRKTGKR